MLFPFNIPCEANQLRGQLRHHWLENQVLNKFPDDVVRLRKKGWPALENEFDLRIEQLKELIENMIEGFSPKQLIDKIGFLSQLPDEKKTALKEVLHIVYLERFEIEDLKKKLNNEAVSFEVVLNQFRIVWRLPEGPDTENQIAIKYQEVLEQAKKLIEIIKKLPKGVALP